MRRIWHRSRHSTSAVSSLYEENNPPFASPALARPQNLAAHGDPDAADLAAACIHGLARNHPFVDGNKRTAWVAGRLFLADNGFGLEFDPADAVRVVEGVAAGRIDEPALADWLRRRVRDRSDAAT